MLSHGVGWSLGQLQRGDPFGPFGPNGLPNPLFGPDATLFPIQSADKVICIALVRTLLLFPHLTRMSISNKVDQMDGLAGGNGRPKTNSGSKVDQNEHKTDLPAAVGLRLGPDEEVVDFCGLQPGGQTESNECSEVGTTRTMFYRTLNLHTYFTCSA